MRILDIPMVDAAIAKQVNATDIVRDLPPCGIKLLDFEFADAVWVASFVFSMIHTPKELNSKFADTTFTPFFVRPIIIIIIIIPCLIPDD